ncbi:cellulose biosynthesis protein BcsQ [Palleronia aestuarii]|uniref:Cellulose biosynthesis protein BcsQ n=2 Tax=Palleronia aestuarii TaxID=568105 RepID=A0A2W7PLY4_9RHOB|nr:cellulose biosynthesis protein BcsQ [Palleronia aestuarii]
MGLSDVNEDNTVWGIMARDLIHETSRMNRAAQGAESGRALPHRRVPTAISDSGLADLRITDFVRSTCWSTIDIVPSCANAAFVEFASAQYRHVNPDWSFFAAVDRWLNALPPDAYDIVIFDCPPAIGYQSMNAVFAADVLYIPSGPGYWEYDSTTSFIGQLSEALADLQGFEHNIHFPAGKSRKEFLDIRFLLTRFEPGNELHRAMRDAFLKVFGDRMTQHPIEHTRAVEQSGRFLSSVYEIDYRDMTRETWRRARSTFDAAYVEFKQHVLTAWDRMEELS